MRPPKHIRASSCDGKVPFDHAAQAHQHVAAAKRRGLRLEAYSCRFCGRWHVATRLGKTPATRKAERQAVE